MMMRCQSIPRSETRNSDVEEERVETNRDGGPPQDVRRTKKQIATWTTGDENDEMTVASETQ